MKLRLFPSVWLRWFPLLAGAALCISFARVKASAAPRWVQGGHAARITGVACSPDGTLIASASEDGTVKLWATNGALLKTLDTQPYATTAIAWSPDGTSLAAGTYYGGYSSKPGLGLTYLWQAPSGWTGAGVCLVRTNSNRFGKVTALAFSADSTLLASGCGGGSNLVTAVVDGSIIASRPAYNTSVGPAAVTSIAFSASGMMASGCEDASIRVYTPAWTLLWNSITNAVAHNASVTAIAFSPDNSLLATASLDQTVKLWSTADWTLQRTLTGSGTGVVSVAFSPDGQEIVSGGMDGAVRIWHGLSGACLSTIAAHMLPVTVTIFSPDGSFIVSGSDDCTVRLWSAADGSAICAMGGPSEFSGALAFSPDGRLCATACSDETIQVRSAVDGSLVCSLPGNTNYVRCLAFSPEGSRLASGGGPLDPTIKLWRVRDGMLLNTIPATTNGVMALAWSPDGLTLAVGGDSVEPNISFWDTNGALHGTLPGMLSGHSNGVTALAFSPQGNLLASGGRRPGNMVRVWTNTMAGIWTTGAVVRSYLGSATNDNVECVTFSPDGTLVGYGRTAVDVLKVGLPNGSDLTLGSGTNPVFSVAFSPDGSTLAATDQCTIGIWTNSGSSTWALCETVTKEVVRACCLAYSPNGNLLLCGREDGSVTMLPNTRGALNQTPMAFNSIIPASPGSTILSATVQPWTHYVLQSSHDLLNWSVLAAFAVTNTNSITIMDSAPVESDPRFYRGMTPP